MVRIFRLMLASLVLSLLTGSSFAQDQLDDSLLIEFHRYSLKIVKRDPTPLVRIYQSGRAQIYHSAFSPLAGIYELQLPTAQVDSLLETILASELDQVDSFDLAVTSTRAEIAQRERGELYYTSDHTVSELSVFVPGARSGSVQLANLQDIDSRFPGLRNISGFAELERQLLKLSLRRDGQRIGNPTPAEAFR